ncbi:MAG TPA: hypothetical protein VHL78_03600 [Actinomycetota bacterium]|nr:hypothetical protein [Actinomycetota bacterium]
MPILPPPRSLLRGAAPIPVVVAVLAVSAFAGATLVRDLKTNPAEFVAYGSEREDRLGLSLTMGDITGDGLADIAAGAPLDEKTNDTQFNRGALHVYFGKPGLSGARDASQIPPDLIVYGEVGGDQDGGSNKRSDVLGKGVAIGDVNGDGRDDLVVSALRADVGSKVRAGKVYVFYQPPTGVWPSTIDLSQASGQAEVDVTILGDRATGEMGIHLAVADFDNDGFDDILAGAPAVLNQKLPGGLRVVYGSASLPQTIDLAAPPGTVRTLKVDGEDPGDKLGHGVAAGDLNADGFGDIIGGAPYGEGDCTRLSGGFAYAVVFYGGPTPPTGTLSSTAANLTVRSDQADDQMGRRLEAGDVTGDGKEDLILGARCADRLGRLDAGAAYVLFGPLGNGTRMLSSAPPNLMVVGAAPGDMLGVGPGAGNITGDGAEELLLGAEGVDGPAGNREFAGALAILFGPLTAGTRDLASNPADLTVHSPDAQDRMGRFVATGDVNADGKGDVGVSAHLADGPNNATGNETGEVHVLTTLSGSPGPSPSPTSSPSPSPSPSPTTPPPPGECTITGTAGNDTIAGTEGDDVICGLEGHDSIKGMGGNDVVFAGPGDDKVLGGAGDDVLHGEDGADTLKGEGGGDTLNGGAGDDGLDSADGVGGNDSIDGGAGTNRCRADPGDTLANCG